MNEILKAFNRGLEQSARAYRADVKIIAEQNKRIRVLTNKCKSERRKERGR